MLASPRLCARDTACARFSTASLMKMCLTCDLTVLCAMASVRAIALLDRPWAMSLRMSLSRPLSGSAIAEVRVGPGRGSWRARELVTKLAT